MIITELRIQNLRNLAQITIKPHPELNFILGDNGAGKTSILESLIVLSQGRSFRTPHAADLLGNNGRTFQVFASIRNQDQSIHRLGIERSGRNWRARKDAQDLKQISQLTRCLPLVLIEPDSHLLVSGPPETRRKLLDWGVFHVKPSFLEIWGRFSKALKQRNAALRSRQADLLDSLDAALLPAAEQLNRLRQEHSVRLGERVTQLLPRLDRDLENIELSFEQGWSEENYADSLSLHRERDLERGQTVTGPHRADLSFKLDQAQARAVLSRGQQKTLSAALLMAQAQLLASGGETPVILMDDLASEFDQQHFDDVLNQAREICEQVWVTGTELPELPGSHRVFHVKHGELRKMV